MRAPPELIMASADACMRMLNARNYQEKDAARREYERFERQISSITKIAQPTHFVPLGADPRGLVR